MLVFVLAASVSCVLAGARGLPRDARTRVFVAALTVATLIALVRRNGTSTPATPLGADTAYAQARAGANPYEAFYWAKLWSESDPAGTLAYAREAERFQLYRTCAEAAEKAPAGAEASALAQRCRQAQLGERSP